MKMLSRQFALTISVCMLATVAGCGPLKTLYADQTLYDGPNDVTLTPVEDDAFMVDMANRFGLMALFAETVYRGELPEDVRDDQGCKYLDPSWKGDANYGMPRVPNTTAGWERWIPDGPGEPPCMKHENGLYYETYVYRDQHGSIREAVIAFRGTENRAGQTAVDWSTNFSAIFGLQPAQYRKARDHLPNLIARLEVAMKENPQVNIYAVGHSLGGGLAQQAGYLSRSIREVFTFNTSPVTNWTFLRFDGAVRQGYPIIHRIYHGGEALEAPRFLATSATSARYRRHDIGVQFGDRQAASGHSMKILACNFGSILSKKMVAGAHFYPTAYINKHVLKAKDAPPSQDPTESSRRICNDEGKGDGSQ